MSHLKILVVEDEPDVASGICDYLDSKGHVADVAYDGLTGLHMSCAGGYDVLVLDINLPGIDGYTLCQRLRDEGINTPILMLTARDTLQDKLQGFNCGADDYLVKPFALQELLVRLLALSKRISRADGKLLQVADLSLNCQTRVVQRAGKTLELTPISCTILEMLLRHSPNVVSRAQLEREIWDDAPPDSNALRSHMYLLRNVVDRDFTPSLIHTVHSVGFKLMVKD